MKVRQEEVIAREDSKGLGDRKYQEAGKKKGIDETLNIQAEEKVSEKHKKEDTEECKAYNWEKEQEVKRKMENIGTSERRPIATFPKTTATTKRLVSSATPKTKPSPQQPRQKKQKKASPPPSSIKPTDTDATNASANVRQTTAETTVVSAKVSQSSATINFNTPLSTQLPPTPQRFPSQPPSPPKRPPPPKFAYVRKRKTFVVQEDDEEIPSPIPLSSVPIQTTSSSLLPPKSTLTPPIGSLPSVIPLAAKYPLELLAFQSEIDSFFKIEDPSKRSFPSLYGFRQPQNLDEYLKMKARQTEVIAREDSKGLGDRKYKGLLSHELDKVRKLDDFSKDLSKSMYEQPLDTELEKELRVDYIDQIMKHKPYKATRSQFKDWSSDALLEEIYRITKMNNDPPVKKTPPNWKKSKQVDPDEAVKFK
ncbi:104 kDa microneme/rhoptry antigen-like [Helianthus annuus]|uniref:104 kDa microneme/rhoptry antigen-like n=1 Tax=Helianthus annuus TaxID=4232 RepID=UPI000B8EF5F2|nr:104 kDa microneme/rhoptry antigen-like [Helianthus annuus]